MEWYSLNQNAGSRYVIDHLEKGQGKRSDGNVMHVLSRSRFIALQHKLLLILNAIRIARAA